MPSLIIAGDATTGLVQSAASDGALTIQSGPAGSKVNAIALASSGAATFSQITGGALTLATAQNTTSGTSIDFTGIPSWVKRITVEFQGVSLSGISAIGLRLGTVSGFETSGYVGVGQRSASSATAENNQTTSFVVNTTAANSLVSGRAVFDLLNSSTNLWTFVFTGCDSTNSAMFVSAGNKPLASALTQVRIFSFNGTDTFDAGSINIMYEG